MAGHVQNKEQSLLKQETLSIISRLSRPLQNDAVAREYEPQLRFKNGNLVLYIYLYVCMYVCISPSSPWTDLQIITICYFKYELYQKPHSDLSSTNPLLCKQGRVSYPAAPLGCCCKQSCCFCIRWYG